MRQRLTLLHRLRNIFVNIPKRHRILFRVHTIAHRLQWDSSQSIFVPIVEFPTSNDAFLLKLNVLAQRERESRRNETQKENEKNTDEIYNKISQHDDDDDDDDRAHKSTNSINKKELLVALELFGKRCCSERMRVQNRKKIVSAKQCYIIAGY